MVVSTLATHSLGSTLTCPTVLINRLAEKKRCARPSWGLERSGNATFEFHSNDLVTSCSDLKPQPVGHVCTSLTTAAANDPRMNPVGGDVDVYLTPLNNFGAHSPHAEATFYIRSCFSTWCAVVPHRSSVCPRRQNILVTRPVPGRLRRRRLQKRRRDGRPLLYVCRGHSEPEYPQYRVHLFVGL